MEVIVCHEKHDTVYWDASTPESWALSSLAILTQRWNSGYWYFDPEEYKPKDLLTDEEVDALPTEELRVSARAQQKAKRLQLKYYEDYRDWYEEAQAVVETQDLSTTTLGRGPRQRQIPKAWDLLDRRSDGEYEGISLEPVHVAGG